MARAEDEKASAGKTMIVLDASGSMWGEIAGQPKIDIAREAVRNLLESLGPNLELGLMAYGHRRKGDCSDIEVLIEPGKVDRKAFMEVVDGIVPVGKTPLCDAVEKAAEELKYEEDPANVVLISDGKETCGRDPKYVGETLEKKGFNFTAHIIAFDLSADDAESFRDLANETGGEFLHASDADTLKDALQIAVEAVSDSQADAKPEIKLDPADLQGPDSVPAGASFKVSWKGPGNKGDYITIVKKSADDGKVGNLAYTRSGSPVDLIAAIDPGDYELRYMAAGNGKVLGRQDVEVTEIEATLKVPETVTAGSYFNVDWEGPGNRGDFITIVPTDADEGEYGNYAYTRNGSPAKVRALSDTGEAEIKYVTGQGRKTLATATITVEDADVLVAGPDFVDAGSFFTVDWKGPGNRGDFITIVRKGTKEGKYNAYGYPKGSAGGALEIRAVEEPGDDYEIRYVDGQDGRTLASAPIEVRPVAAGLEVPDTVVGGSEIEVEWSGPSNRGDLITIVPVGTKIGTYHNYFYTKNEESPTQLRALEEPGEAEVRFMTDGGKMLVSKKITIEAAEATVEPPEEAEAGSTVEIEWTGPANKNDQIAIAEKGSEPRDYLFYVYVKGEDPLELEMPETEGDYEIRYVTAKERIVLAKADIRVNAATAKFTSVPEKMTAGDRVEIEWEGPDNKGDTIIMVKEGTSNSNVGNSYFYTNKESPQEIRVPEEAGAYELRYITRREKKILAKKEVTVVEE